jgi:hypothetical protein
MKINKPLLFVFCLLVVSIALSIYFEIGKEGFVIEAVSKMVTKRINKQYRPVRRNLIKHKKNLMEDFEKMVYSIDKK